MIKKVRGDIMSSLKEFEQYRVMVITMDDLIFNLNELRYDFLQLLYPKTFGNISYQDYSKRLGTIQSMYGFIQPGMINALNTKIEDFIYDNKNLHNIILKESADALLNLVKSKGIKVIILTTHDKLRAKQLLAYRHLDQDIDQVISISETCKDIPSIKLFHALSNLYQVNVSNILLITSLDSLFQTIQYSPIDSIFVPDNKNSYYNPNNHPTTAMTSLFDVLQYALFGKYTSSDIYKDFLGYDENMNEQQKRNRYTYLKMKYENHPEILPIVDEVFSKNINIPIGDMKTQAFNQVFNDIEEKFENINFEQESSDTFLNFQALRENEKVESTDNLFANEQTAEEKSSPIFSEMQEISEPLGDTPTADKQEESHQTIEEVKMDTSKENSNTVEEIKSEDNEPIIFDTTQEFTLEHLDKTVDITKITDKAANIFSDDKIQEIFDDIEDNKVNQQSQKESDEQSAYIPDQTVEIPHHDTTVKKEKINWLEVILTGILNFLTAFLFVSFCGIIYMCFYEMSSSMWFIKAFFDLFFVGFANICEMIYNWIVSPFPSLAMDRITIVSPLFIKYMMMVFVIFLIINAYKITHYFLEKNENHYNGF